MTLDRRTFVQAAGAAVVMPLVLPAAAARTTRVNNQITLGFIGMGIRGKNLMRGGGFLGNEGVRILAVCDVDRNRRENRRDMVNDAYENKDCAAYLDYREILARDDIDAVVINTPDHWHAIQGIEACTAGKDVYCEKPLTLTIREAQLMIEAARRHGTVFQTGSQQRTEYGHRFVKACEYVRNGRIGRLLTVNVGVGDPARWCDLPGEEPEPGLDWDRWLGPAPQRDYNSELSPRGVHNHYPRWRGYREYSGGYFTDMGAHHFDIAHWGLGADEAGPVRVEPPREGADRRGAMLHYPGGVTVTHGGPSGTTFIGTGGMIHVDRGRLVSVPEKILDDPIGEGDEVLARPANHLQDWVDCMHSRERPICDVEVGSRTVTACHLINLAYWEGRAFDWDPKTWRFTDDGDPALLDYERRDGYQLPTG